MADRKHSVNFDCQFALSIFLQSNAFFLSLRDFTFSSQYLFFHLFSFLFLFFFYFQQILKRIFISFLLYPLHVILECFCSSLFTLNFFFLSFHTLFYFFLFSFAFHFFFVALSFSSFLTVMLYLFLFFLNSTFFLSFSFSLIIYFPFIFFSVPLSF